MNRKRKLSGSEDEANASGIPSDKVVKLEPVSVPGFIASLESEGNAINELQKFKEAADLFASGCSTDDVVHQFLAQTGGNLHAVASLIRKQKSTTVAVAWVYRCLELLLQRVADESPHLSAAVVSSVQQALLQSRHHLEQSLSRSRSKFNHVRSALRMLTALAMLGPEGARLVTQVVRFNDVHFRVLLHWRSWKEPEDVRTCAVYLLLSIVAAGRNTIARQVLENEGLFSTIFSGLVYDRASFICNFLLTLRLKVVRNMAFAKTMKLHIFNEKVLQYVVQLLSWDGPKEQKVPEKLKKFRRMPSGDDDEETRAAFQVSQEDTESVRGAALEFLKEVCCSHKTGISFRDTSLALTKNVNPTITKILHSGSKLYESQHGQEFLVEVMRACPDQISHYLHSWMPLLLNGSASTVEKIIELLQKVVAIQDIALFLHNMAEKSPTEMCEAVKTLSLFDFLPCIIEAECMQASNSGLGIHLAFMELLLASLGKICSVLNSLKSNPFALLASPEAQEKFEAVLIDAVFQSVPPPSDLVSKYLAIASKAALGRQVLSTATEKENPLIHVRGKYCLAILKVLEQYWAVFTRRSDFHSGGEHISWELLWQLCQVSTEALQRDVPESLQLRALRLVITAAPALESLFTESETSVFHQLLALLSQETDEMTRKQASSLVVQVLCKMSVLEIHGMEMTIWVEKFCLAPSGQHAALRKMFTSAVQLLSHDPNMYNDEVMQWITESDAQKGQGSGKLWDVLRNNTECNVNTEKLDSPDCGMFFSPLLPAILESLQGREPVCQQYVDAVVVEILHMKKQPEVLCAFLENSLSVLSSSIQCYIEILSEGGLEHTTQGPTSLEPSSFYAPLVPKVGNIFIRDIAATRKKQKRKSMSSGADVEDLMSALRDIDASSRSSLTRQLLSYLKAIFGHEELLFLVPQYLTMLEVVLEPSLDTSDMQGENAVCLANLLLCHETTLTWYLNTECLDTAYWAPSLEYTQLVLSAILRAHQKCDPATLSTILDSLCVLKNKTVRSISSGVAAFSHLLRDIVKAFATTFTKHDKVVVLESMLALPGDIHLEATEMVVADLGDQSQVRQQAHATLSSAAISRIVAMKLSLDKDSRKTEEEKFHFGNIVLHLFMSSPYYCAALEPGCIQELASSAYCLELLSFIIERSPVHGNLFHSMISRQEISLHHAPSPHGMVALLHALVKTWPLQQIDEAVTSWVVKHFIKLPKLLSIVEEHVPYSVVQLIADTTTSLLSLKLLGRKEIQKLVDRVSDTKDHLLQLVLLNRICGEPTSDFKEPLLDSLLQHLFTSVCKAAQNEELDTSILEELKHTAMVLKQFNGSSIARVVCGDHLWQHCIVILLKSAFKSLAMGAAVFELICGACERVYIDAGVTPHPNAANLYMMILGHSKFLSLMLSMDAEAQETRGSLLQLMTTLVKCDKSVCNVDHVPVFLSAYGATLSTVDQKILYLLYLYEESGVKMSISGPYMWGPSAASFYSVYKKSSRTLFKQPKTEEVLGLFSETVMTSSFLKFPLDLDLQPIPREDAVDMSVYDPRFVLPLLHNLLSPGSLLHCRQFVELRFLAYVLHSLCSEVFQVRSLGYNILSLFYHHLESSRYSNSAFWLCILESLRNALTVTSARLPCLLVGYLTSAAQVIHNPAHDAFNPVLNFLLAKPVISVGNVPDFYRMFFNQSVKHRFRRIWFLEVIASNLRSSLDFHICCNRYILGILKAYFMAPICNKQSKELVLRIFLAAVKIPKAARTLCREQGLLAWVSAALAHNSEDAALTQLLFSIVHQVWLSSCAEILTYMDKMAVALKKEHEAISLLAPEHKVKTEVLRGHSVESIHAPRTVPAAYSDAPASEDTGKTHPPKRRFYEHFPFEFLLSLCDMSKYVRNCSDMTAATEYIQDMADAFTYVHARNSWCLSVGGEVFRPTTQLILSISQIWEHFSSSGGAEKLAPLGWSIVQVCVHWLPTSPGSQSLWTWTLHMALEYGKREDSGRLLKWMSLWLKNDRPCQAVISDCEHINKIIDRARDVLCSGDCAPGYETVTDVMSMLFSQVVEDSENEGLRTRYEKAIRSLRKKSFTDKQKALATMVLLQELLLKKPKPHLSGICSNRE